MSGSQRSADVENELESGPQVGYAYSIRFDDVNTLEIDVGYHRNRKMLMAGVGWVTAMSTSSVSVAMCFLRSASPFGVWIRWVRSMARGVIWG